MDLTYTALSDGFKIAKNDDGNIVFARNDTSLFIASPAELNAVLAPLIGTLVASAAPDTSALDMAKAALALQAKQIGDLQDQIAADKVAAADALAASTAKIASFEAQIATDQSAAAQIQATIAAANTGAENASIAAETPAAQGAAQGVAAASVSAEAPTIAPSNTGISGS